MGLNIGTPNNHDFPFGTNGKVVVCGVPILKHFRVCFYAELTKIISNYHQVLPLMAWIHLHVFCHFTMGNNFCDYRNNSIYWDPVCIGTPFILKKIIILTIILIGTY